MSSNLIKNFGFVKNKRTFGCKVVLSTLNNKCDIYFEEMFYVIVENVSNVILVAY